MKLEEVEVLKNQLLLSDRIVSDVLDTLKSRRGFLQWWLGLDFDQRDQVEAALFTAVSDRVKAEAEA